MKKWNIKTQQGFTIVELLLTIVIVAILASLSVSAFSGTQQRSRDSRRVSDMNTIVKALEIYKVQTGTYPPTSTTNTISGWEVSSKNPDQFLSALKTTDVTTSTIPVDPINNSLISATGFLYRYYRYTAGSNTCDPSRGEYYVLVVGKAETTSNQLTSSPGFRCTGRDWSTEGGWVTGGYVK